MIIRTTLLLASITGLFLAMGYLIGGQSGMVMGFMLSMVMNVGSYWFSDSIVLSMHGAKPISKGKIGDAVYRDVVELAARAEIPTPRVYVYQDTVPNAFATGRDPDHSIVAFSSGILERLSHSELRGVIAHELAHIKNRDMLVSTIAATFAGAISMLAQMGYGMFGSGRDDEHRNPFIGIVVMLIAPITATLIHMAVSRTREYGADEEGARISGDPLGLASALSSIHASMPKGRVAQALADDPMRQSFSHMYIFGFDGGSLSQLFSTHPPVDERIKRLRAMHI